MVGRRRQAFGARLFYRLRVPPAGALHDPTLANADVDSEAAHINQSSAVLVAAGSLTFVVAPILHAIGLLPEASYVLVAVFAGGGVYLACMAALTRTGSRTVGEREADEIDYRLWRLTTKERYLFWSSWFVGLGLAALFIVVLAGSY